MTHRLQMTSKDARTLRRGVIVIAAIVAIGKGLPALHAIESRARAGAAEAARELSSLRAAARAQGAMRDSLRVRARRLESLRGSLIHATSPQLAAAELAGALGEFATGVGARINSVVVRSDSAFTKGVARISVRLSMTTDIQGVAELLNSVEADPWLVAVRELSVSGSDPAAPDTRAEVLVVELVVDALALDEIARPARGKGAHK